MQLAEEATAPEAMIRLMNSRRVLPPVTAGEGDSGPAPGWPGMRGGMGWGFCGIRGPGGTWRAGFRWPVPRRETLVARPPAGPRSVGTGFDPT